MAQHLTKSRLYKKVSLGYGYFDTLHENSQLRVYGWMSSSTTSCFDSFALYLDNQLSATVEPGIASNIDLAEVPAGMPWLYEFSVSVEDILKFRRLDIVAYWNGQAVARLSTLSRTDMNTLVPTPPEHLMYRVTGNRDGKLVKAAGLRCASEFLDAISRHRDLGSIRRLLDWGCGCGRVTVHLADYLSKYEEMEVWGFDIDSEAIDWCNDHLSSSRFLPIEPYPPTPRDEATFDVVVSCSVFTHLARDLQRDWLVEMNRIIAPGGLFFASVTTKYRSTQLPKDGISDGTHDPMLDGIAPNGYYRSTHQTREYTMREWSKYFEILEFIDHGIESSQDLVVMRRPD